MTLYIVPTPLGNLEDITLRAIRILREVDVIATEDTRTTGKLLKHLEISNPMISYHDHTREEKLEQIIDRLVSEDVALVSEAGTPLLSDPGYRLVHAAIEQNIDVVALPGANAITTALATSGLPPDQFTFFGFLPRKEAARNQLLSELSSWPTTLIFFESPHRLKATLVIMKDSFGETRQIAICREMTKLHEEIWRGTLADAVVIWQEREPRGEFTLVVQESITEEIIWDEDQVEQAVAQLLASGSGAKKAAQAVALQSGWSKKLVYELAQKVKENDNFKK